MMHYRFLPGLLLLWFLTAPFCDFAQPYYNQRPEFIKGNSVWVFGIKAGLDFNGGLPAAIQTNVMNYEGVASVADRNTGQLLFYSTGGLCYDRNHTVMPNGWGLQGNAFFVSGLLPGDEQNITEDGQTTQGACIVPVIGSSDQYYLFSLSGTSNGGPTTNGTLFYSVVDMSLNGGLGDIIGAQKNIALNHDTLSEAMIAVPGNNCDIWLVVHDYVYPRFKAYHITAQGIDPNPVVSVVAPYFSAGNNSVIGGLGSAIPGTFQTGGMTISPDRKQLVLCSWQPYCIYGYAPNTSGTILCRFDAETGIFSDGFQIEKEQVSYVAAFSPDNTKLYVFNDDNITEHGQLLQFDITLHDSLAVAASKTVVYDRLLPDALYLRQYKDKIYVNYTGYVLTTPLTTTELLGVINQPDLPGALCNYQQPGPLLYPATHGSYSLPNEVVYPYPPDTAGTTSNATLCAHNGAGSLVLSAAQGYQGYLWSNGDNNSSSTITAPGVYWVLCIDPCHSRRDTIIVSQTDLDFTLGSDTSICGPGAYILDPGVPGAAYLWQDNSTNAQYPVANSGSYSVLVTKGGCTAADTVIIAYTELDLDLGADLSLCKGTEIKVTLHAEVPPGASVAWNNGSRLPDLTVSDTGTYWATASTLFCKDSDTVKISQEVCECGFNIPSAFSPNGDGVNDMMRPVIESGCLLGSYIFNIYNRYGERIYSGVQYSDGWDGKFKGQEVEAGTYMYELRFEGGTRRAWYYRKGDLVLVR